MSAEDSQQDQSMEEILQSIKRIISEDEEEGAVEDDKNALAEDDKVAGSDVLELTDMLDEEPAAEEAPSIEDLIDDATSSADEVGDVGETDDAGEAAAEDIMALLNDMAGDDAETPEEEKPEETTPSEADISEGDGLVSDGVADDAAGAFAALADSVGQEEEVSAPKEVPEFRSGNTIEDLVMESLRPLLREWLDDNLSQLVKRLVQREIEKIATQRHF